MNAAVFDNPALTVALALMLGMALQVAAHHLRIPGIVLLLAAGVAAGPDGLGLIQPHSLGAALILLTKFAVAIILFEGGLNLKFSRLRRSQRSIRQLILFGGLVTIGGAALAVRFIMGWSWVNAVLFGTLVMVTGPTVVNPLLKRLKVRRTVATVLEAEGILIDAVGAVVAIVALEAALSPAASTPLIWVWHIVARLGFGAVLGALAGLLLNELLRFRRLIPDGFENVFTLSAILALFQSANLLFPESGIAAVIMAGVVMGNLNAPRLTDLLKFKEELTVLLLGLLFVLLAADVRLSQVAELGWPAVGVVLALIFLVRPAAVAVGTANSGLQWRERLFIAWIGPRGIVAAAVASFFAATFIERGMSGGYEMRAMVFLVIAVTVLTAGLTGGVVARWLDLQQPRQLGWLILGASPLGRTLARLFQDDGQPVICIDSNLAHCRGAEEYCTSVIHGNGLDPHFLQLAAIDTRRGALALTGNSEVNYLFVRAVKDETREAELFAALEGRGDSLTPQMLHKSGVECLFGAPCDIESWNSRIESELVSVECWEARPTPGADPAIIAAPHAYGGNGLLGLAYRHGGRLVPLGDLTRLRPECDVYLLIFTPQREAVLEYLMHCGWQPAASSQSAPTDAAGSAVGGATPN